MKLIISIIIISIIILILVYIKKNFIKQESSKIYEKGINIINNLQDNIEQKKIDYITKNDKYSMNFQDLENDFPILLDKIKQNKLIMSNERLKNTTKKLLKLLSIKDNIFELNKRLKQRSANMIDYIEKDRDRAFEAQNKVKAQKKMVEKTIEYIKNSDKKQEELNNEIDELKIKHSDMQVRIAEKKLKDEKKKTELLKNINDKTQKITDYKTKYELSLEKAKNASDKARTEASIAEKHKFASKTSSLAAKASMIKAKNEKDAVLAKSMLDKVKAELSNDKGLIKNLVELRKQNDNNYIEKIKFEREIIIKLKNDLDNENENVENLKHLIIKNGESNILIENLKAAIKKQKIAQLNFDNSKYLIRNMFKNFNNNKNNSKINLGSNVNNYKDKLQKQLQLEKEYLKKQYDLEYSKKREETLKKNAEIALNKAKEFEKEELRLLEIQNKKKESDKLIQDAYDKQNKINEDNRLLEKNNQVKNEKKAELELQRLKNENELLKKTNLVKKEITGQLGGNKLIYNNEYIDMSTQQSCDKRLKKYTKN